MIHALPRRLRMPCLFLAACLLLGCHRPAPMAAPDRPLPLTLRLDMGPLFPARGVQHVASDIKRLVIGLVDQDPDATPDFGLEVSPGPVYATEEPTDYHAAIAGTLQSGTHQPGALDLSDSGLEDAQKVNFARYLYTTTTAPGSEEVVATFTGLRPGGSRYVVFAAALSQSANAGVDHVIGFAQQTVSGQPSSAPLTLTLDRVVGIVNVHVNINGSLSNPLSAVQELVVGVLDTQTDASLRPLSLGYRYESPIGGGEAPLSTSVPSYFPSVRDTISSSLNEVQASEWTRYLWHRHSHDSSHPVGTTVARRLLNLPASATSGDYVIYALAFKQGLLGSDTFSENIGRAQISLSLSAQESKTVNLTIDLDLL